MLTVIGKLAVPDDDEATAFPPGSGKTPSISDMERIEIGMVGLIPELASDLISEDELIIRSEKIELEGWFEEKGDPYFNSGEWTSELLLDKNIMADFGLEEGDLVYYLGQDGKPVASLEVRGSVKTSIIGNGLSRELVSGIGLVHLSELQRLTGNDLKVIPGGNISDLVNAIYIDLSEERRDAPSQREMVIYLEGLFPGLKVTSKESRIYRLEEVGMVLQFVSYGVRLTTLFIGSMFLSSIMVLDVEDRRSEIAVMRAIGISRRTIYLQILKDSLMLSSLGVLVGLIPAYLAAGFLDSRLRSFYGVDIDFSLLTPGLVLLCVSFLLFFVIIFSILPGMRSMRIDVKKGLARFNHR